jgi:hypothetical protein
MLEEFPPKVEDQDREEGLDDDEAGFDLPVRHRLPAGGAAQLAARLGQFGWSAVALGFGPVSERGRLSYLFRPVVRAAQVSTPAVERQSCLSVSPRRQEPKTLESQYSRTSYSTNRSS